MKLYTGMTVAVQLPENPTKVEAFAAEELQKYLQKIFKTVTFDAQADITFIIGQPHEKVTGTEGFAYKIQGNTAYLSGNTTGQLYAVYEFLEQELGCCFGTITMPDTLTGEVVPTRTEIDLADTERYKADADLHYRAVLLYYNTVQCKRKCYPLVFLDAAVVMGIQKCHFGVLIERNLLQVNTRRIHMGT